MSGTAAGTFAQTWAPYANQAGQTLGINPALILQQWAFESGYGSNTATVSGNNPGAIAPGGNLTSYSSPAAFTQSYVSTIENNFPGAVGAGSNAAQFLQGLGNGTLGSYWGSGSSLPAYGLGLAGTGNAIASADPGLYQSLSGGQALTGIASDGTGVNLTGAAGATSVAGGVAGGTGPTLPAAAASACNGLGSVLSAACWGAIGADVLLVVFGAALILFSVGASFKGSSETVVNIVKGRAA